MIKGTIFLLIAGLSLTGLAWAGDEISMPKDTCSPEEKFYDTNYSAMKKAEDGLNFLYMKTPPPNEEVNLKKTEETFFLEGTLKKKRPDYFKEAEKNRWEEWSPVFYEFGRAFKKMLFGLTTENTEKK